MQWLKIQCSKPTFGAFAAFSGPASIKLGRSGSEPRSSQKPRHQGSPGSNARVVKSIGTFGRARPPSIPELPWEDNDSDLEMEMDLITSI
mmetsp:Transcript_15337/g.42315  ORF Transcript_15337/g.42315 Transcript_15337/m.42315 type:complete len:90 (-) Transcript_15337:82-351(-)